ncbi:ribosomal protein L7/L12 [Sphaerisporangium aureirubrum]|uniref:Ribosomal protein L7/L12 n=1 Tax=Sphaerisporangium aureirubrum TaxID=1544736 RepID=A0ABW1NCU9_9ACTN
MPSIGPFEFVILLVLAAVAVGLVFGVVAVARRGGGKDPAPVVAPQDLEPLIAHLVRERQLIQAIKEVRQSTGLGLAEAKAVVDGVAAGRSLYSRPSMARFQQMVLPPTPQDLPQDLPPDLATRVRQLKAAGRTEQAVHLVRGETGMEDREARLFVDSL